jgi:hypothetical protein
VKRKLEKLLLSEEAQLSELMSRRNSVSGCTEGPHLPIAGDELGTLSGFEYEMYCFNQAVEGRK